MITNVLEYLEASSNKYPEKVAIADEVSEYSYKELLKISKIIGFALSQKTNIKKPIVIYMEKNCSALISMLGTIYAGCFYAILNTLFPKDRLSSILETLDAEILITDKKYIDKANELQFGGTILQYEDLISNTVVDDSLLLSIRNNSSEFDPLYVIFTSGSTGVPKGIVVNHKAVIDFIENFTSIFNLNSYDIIGNQAPFDFDVSVKDIYSTLKIGATLQIIPAKLFSFPPMLLDFLDERKITVLIWAVSALCIITELNGLEYKIPKYIQKILFSGELMPIKHLNKWIEKYPNVTFVNLYGPAEITCNCMYYIINKKFNNDEQIPLGKNFPNKYVFLLDENDNLISENQTDIIGEICVSGNGLSSGYYNNIEMTKKSFVLNPLDNSHKELIYKTGDLGKYDKDLEMYFVSRKDFQIKRMGYRIELEGIERIINSLDGIIRCCCIYDKINDTIICYYVGIPDSKTILAQLKTKIPKIMFPSVFYKLDSLELNKNGKIDRKKLLDMYMSKGS